MDPQAHVVFVGPTRIPNVMTQQEAADAAKTPAKFGDLTSKLFTTEYESAMVLGTIRQLASDEDKTHGLRVIAQKFTPQWMKYFPQAAENSLAITAVYAIDITRVTAKRKKFDPTGQEMKWQRQA